MARASKAYFEDWIRARCSGKAVLDYGCGDGYYSLCAAGKGAFVTGIDISEVSVENCKREAARKQLNARTSFHVMDCEALGFEDSSFDLIMESGVLHHLDLQKSICEMARVLKPDGQVICYEAVGHNPIIQLYRRMTPELRTEYETDHILRMRDLDTMKHYFGRIDIRFFHLTALAGVPFRRWRQFSSVLSCLEAIDRMLLKLPWVGRFAWIMVFSLSQPHKCAEKASRNIRAPVSECSSLNSS